MSMEIESGAVGVELLQPDVVLPIQFFGPLRTRVPDKGGEYRLLVAVLEDAVRCFQCHAFARDYRSRRLFEETKSWILDRGGGADRAFSFEYICAVLDLDADGLREGLQRWRQERLP